MEPNGYPPAEAVALMLSHNFENFREKVSSFKEKFGDDFIEGIFDERKALETLEILDSQPNENADVLPDDLGKELDKLMMKQHKQAITVMVISGDVPDKIETLSKNTGKSYAEISDQLKGADINIESVLDELVEKSTRTKFTDKIQSRNENSRER